MNSKSVYFYLQLWTPSAFSCLTLFSRLLYLDFFLSPRSHISIISFFIFSFITLVTWTQNFSIVWPPSFSFTKPWHFFYIIFVPPLFHCPYPGSGSSLFQIRHALLQYSIWFPYVQYLSKPLTPQIYPSNGNPINITKDHSHLDISHSYISRLPVLWT